MRTVRRVLRVRAVLDRAVERARAVRVRAVERARAVRLRVVVVVLLLVLRALVLRGVRLAAERVARGLAELDRELLVAELLLLPAPLLVRVRLDEAERPVLRVELVEVVKNFWPTFTNCCWLPLAFCSCLGVMLPLAMAQSMICWNKLV